METDRKDGTELVVSFTVDVNENRAEGYKTHTLHPHCAHSVFQKGPKESGTAGETRVTSQDTDINGFLEPEHETEPSPEPDNEDSSPETSGHIWTPDGLTGCLEEMDQNRNRKADCFVAHVRCGLGTHSDRVVNVCGFCPSEGTESVCGTNSSVFTSGEVPGTGRAHSGAACPHALNGTAADVWGFHADTVVIGESSGDRITSAETSVATGCNKSWAVTGDAEPDGNPTAARTINGSDGEEADVWEFICNPFVIGETSVCQTTCGELTETRWAVKTSQTNTSPCADKMVDLEGSSGSLATTGEAAFGDAAFGDAAFGDAASGEAASGEAASGEAASGEAASGEAASGEAASGEAASGRRTNSKQTVGEQLAGTCETNLTSVIADHVADYGGTLVSLFTFGDSEDTRRICTGQHAAEEIPGNDANVSTSGETAATRRTCSDPVGVTQGTINMFDIKTSATVTGDPMSMTETSGRQVVAGPMDTLGQVPGIPLLRNHAAKSKSVIWENPGSPECERKCVRSCCSHEDMKISNGHVNFGEGTSTAEVLDKGVRVGNRGYLVINPRSVSGVSSIPIYSVGEPRNTGEHPPEATVKPSADNDNEDVSKREITGAEVDGDVGVETPRSLRTNPGHASSLSCDSTPLNLDNAAAGFGDDGDMEVIMDRILDLGRRQSAPEELLQRERVDPKPSANRIPGKRHGFTEFLTRSLFSWKPKETTDSGWRLFGKKETGCGESGTPAQQREPVRRKNLEFEPLSTMGLILEDRPANLPAKSEEEAHRHRQLYNEMISGAKRRELKEAQRKKKQMKERHRQEESVARAGVVWNNEILPNWENVKNTRRVRELWWQGLPPSIRGKIWSLAIGNELNITSELYEIFLSRAKDKWRSFSETGSLSENEDCAVDKESSLDLIKLDIFRTFPSLFIFQKGGPYHDVLHNVLGAYTCYRPDVGYVQGMSFIAAVLILNLEEADAFIAFANLLNKPCQMAFFRVDHDLMLKYFAAFEVFFVENLPKLFQHFQNNSLTPDFYLIDWIFTLYSKPLPLDVACRVWDLFFRDGEEALFRTALGILRLYQDVLLQMDFIHSAQFLSRLLQNTPAHTLFTCIANTHMLSNNRRWNQVFSALIKDGPKEADKTGSPPLPS